MSNPNNAIGTNAAYGTRTSVNAFNDICQLANGRGVLSGWSVVPKSGMAINVGGVAGIRDVAIAEDNLGNRTTINNRVGEAIELTVSPASASSRRIDAVVAYVRNPAQAEDTTPDAPSVCGIIVAQGGTSGITESQIRSAISADGGGGSTAYYAVLANISVPAGTTTITSSNITPVHISISASDIADGEITSRMLDWTSFSTKFERYDSKGDKTINVSDFPTGAKFVVLINGYVQTNAQQVFYLSATYGSQPAVGTWSDNKHSAVYSRAMTNMNQFTKEAGNNQLTIHIGQQNHTANEANFSVLVMRVA